MEARAAFAHPHAPIPRLAQVVPGPASRCAADRSRMPRARPQMSLRDNDSTHLSRRGVISSSWRALVGAGLAVGLHAGSVAVVKAESKPRVKSLEEYRSQIDAGYDVMLDLERNWTERTKAFDGDIVRRYLGTVGKSSPLFNIKKAFMAVWKSLSERDDVSDADLEELNEKYNLVLDGISGVDFQLYSVNFSELRPTKEKLIEDGKKALDKTVGIYKEVLAILARNE
ncbi:hypothetical protein FVE85_7049 [Porphyridium purpureum]|uniref:Oxygen-evolving enhancer protein 3, chloroplastic n=1 Tax=Porphyridium purpureum TaxID=35688 RepID=A0A5J4Z903_PORPP|nr:hypothetical protein FVE85_7049 [Porphyridium purpureum]|eukprot:POR6857..scf295_1